MHREPFPSSSPDQLLGAALEALPHGVVVADARQPDLPVAAVNDAFVRLSGYGRDAVVGRNLRILQGPGTDAAELARLRAALRDEEPYLGELLNYRPDGTAWLNALTLTPLHDEDGLTSHWVATQIDVTPLRRRSTAAEHRARLDLVDGFARTVAHDVNNVLLATSGYAELLVLKLADTGDEQVRGYAQQIVGAAESGRTLTQRLLRNGRDAAADPVVDVAAVVAATVALARASLPDGATLRLELPAAPALVRGEAAQVEQLLLDLLADVEAPAEIVVLVEAEASTVRLAVTPAAAAGDDGLHELLRTSLVRRLGGALASGGGAVIVSLPRVALG